MGWAIESHPRPESASVTLLAALGRDGIMFILIIWLQGIWLPEHGYSFVVTPLWAGIYMLPMTVGFLIAGPISGYLSDHYGARPFATGGMLIAALSFGLLELLPADFGYPVFAALLLLNGMAMGLFASPNRAGIMNSLPATQRGAGSGMTATFQNSAMVLSIGIFFTLIITGLAGSLPSALYHGLTAQGLPASAAAKVAHLPPTGAFFAAFLGYNPVKTLLGPALVHLAPARVSYLTGRTFFASLISAPFMGGLHEAFDFAVAACLVAAVASWLRGGKFHYEDRLTSPAGAAEPINGAASDTATGRGEGPKPPGDDHSRPGDWRLGQSTARCSGRKGWVAAIVSGVDDGGRILMLVVALGIRSAQRLTSCTEALAAHSRWGQLQLSDGRPR